MVTARFFISADCPYIQSYITISNGRFSTKPMVTKVYPDCQKNFWQRTVHQWLTSGVYKTFQTHQQLIKFVLFLKEHHLVRKGHNRGLHVKDTRQRYHAQSLFIPNEILYVRKLHQKIELLAYHNTEMSHFVQARWVSLEYGGTK